MKRKFLLLVYCSILVLSNITAQEKLYQNAFPLSDVTLLNGPFKNARDLNIQTLLKYDVDRLLAPYRKEAGLTPKATSFPNWIALDGHIGGHYLSAMAMNYKATGNSNCKQRMDYMVSELKACQDANASNYPSWGVGYTGGVPNSNDVWSNFKSGNFGAFWSSWVPWYNLHKTYAGLRDAWLYGDNDEARAIFLKFCDWGISITSALSDDQMESMLGMEHGGINEMFADAYQMTGDTKYLTAAKRFSHKYILNAMAASNDILDNMHANTQIPKAIGFQRIAEVSNDNTYAMAGSFFWQTVNGNRSLALGGNSRQEHFPSASKCSDYVNVSEGPESCNTHNMLKLAEDLFRVNPLAKYADFYERALYNHILSTQHPEHGGYVYFTSARPRHYRVYSAPNLGMWCCVGSGMENHGKYGGFIYTHRDNSLYLNLFIASELNWKDRGIKIKQETNFPYEEATKLSVTAGSGAFKLMIRYPSWVTAGAMNVTVNGVNQTISAQPSSYIAIDRTWATGDVVVVTMPMHNTIEQLPNVSTYIAIMHGPILLGAKTGTEDLAGIIADDGRWSHIAGGTMLPIDKAPVLVEDSHSSIANKIAPVSGKPLTFSFSGLNVLNMPSSLELEPFFKIHDSRYMMYWMTLTNSQYQEILDSIAAAEAAMIALQKRTIDAVGPGQQQPEVDHAMQSSNSSSGNYNDEYWRDANNGGYFSYNLATNNESDLSLMVRYWGNEGGYRTFDILIDDVKLVTENLVGKWNVSEFRNVEYPIPNSMIAGKSSIRVKFLAPSGGTAGGAFYVRLLRPAQTSPPITPYIQVNDGSWQQTSSVTVNSGDKVKFGPQPVSGGSWSWTGCGTSGSSREQTFTANSSCTATATYTNSSGSMSTQNFDVTVSGSNSGNVMIQNKVTTLYIDGMGRYSNGDNAGQWGYSGSSNQQWTMEPSGSNVMFKNVATSLYLDGMGRSSDGSLAGQWGNSNSPNQQWTIETYGSFNRIKNVATGLYLDGMNWSTNGSDLGQYGSSGSDAQQWTITSLKSAVANSEELSKVDKKNSDILLFPNPFTSETNLRIDNPEQVTSIVVLDMLGRQVEVIDHAAVKNSQAIGISLKAGIYVVQVCSGGKVQSFKVIKK